MIRIKIFLIAVSSIYFLSTCSEDDACCDGETINSLSDTWLLFETGYSPGSGYIVGPVSDTPAQTMVFQPDGAFLSNIQQVEEYTYYLLLPDGEKEVLALYKEKPVEENPNLDSLEHSYTVEFQDDGSVKLYFRFCIEGCHLGLRKVNN